MVIESDEAPPRPPRPLSTTRRAALIAAPLALAAVAAATWWVARPAATTDVRGVRLGLGAADTRERFSPSGPGQWASDGGTTAALRWTAQPPVGAVHEAVFEFHQGMLVAIRLRLDPASGEAAGAALEVTPGRIVARERQGEEALLTVLSRTCPGHADEVARRLSGR